MLEGSKKTFGLPFVVEQVRHRIGNVLQFSDALPAVHFPFDAIAGLVLADAGATVLCLAVSFDFFEIGGHGFKNGRTRALLKEQYSKKPLSPGAVVNRYKPSVQKSGIVLSDLPWLQSLHRVTKLLASFEPPLDRGTL